ncbi:TBC1 domain family member 2B-like isoform X2 [Oratosquilla oratoria]|uniref:TBC1 domain family member 2B-like isoform X2 n=1 Tax=Oratosquilla oratoria TaxID=337810 RepID=UPI003F761C91
MERSSNAKDEQQNSRSVFHEICDTDSNAGPPDSQDETLKPGKEEEEETCQKSVKRKQTTTSGDYSLCGYLTKISRLHSIPVPGLGTKTSTKRRQRWFVYSDKTCRLYYYKHKNGVEPLGEIDISIASFSYDVDNGNECQFSIRWGSSEAVLEADSTATKLHWLMQLQKARKEYSHRRTNAATPAKRTPSTGRPDSGLLHHSSDDEGPRADPLDDLLMPISPKDAKPTQPISTPSPSSSSSPLSALSSLLPNAPRSIFKNVSDGRSKSPSSLSPSPLRHRVSSPHSPIEEQHSFGKFGKKFRESFRAVKRSPSTENRDGLDTCGGISPPVACRRCDQLRKQLSSTQEDLVATQDELRASRQVIDLLRQELASLHRQNDTWSALDHSDLTDSDLLAILRQKDRQIVALEFQHQEEGSSSSRLSTQLEGAMVHQEHLQEKLSMLTCLIEAKDKAIMSLTHQLEDLKVSKGLTRPFLQPNLDGRLSRSTQTMVEVDEEALHDALTALKNQNSFLNKEILDLNHLREQASLREQKLIVESAEWEAKFYQTHSKYLLLLNELHSPDTARHDPTIVSRLLQDVVQSQGSPDLRMVRSGGRQYDEYGFCVGGPDDTSLESQAAHFAKRAHLISHQSQLSNGSRCEERWESFLAATSSRDLLQCPELKYLIRHGIPYQYKGKVWRLYVDYNVSALRSALPPNYYQDLLARETGKATLEPAAKQIELDLLRTLPNNRHYNAIHADGIPRLRRVLLAYARHNVAVGYCQGLNRLAAVALLFLNEEDAFWCLVYIIEYLMPPNYYTKNLVGSQVDQRVLKDLVCEKLPRLHAHMESLGMEVALFTFNWFLCVYVDVIPHEVYLTIWDAFLSEGTKVLFRYCLAVLKVCEEGILGYTEYTEVFNYMRAVPPPVLNIAQLQETAFSWVNPLSMKVIRNKRATHLVSVQAEVQEIEAFRDAYKNSPARRSSRPPPQQPRSGATSPFSSQDEDDEEDDDDEVVEEGVDVLATENVIPEEEEEEEEEDRGGGGGEEEEPPPPQVRLPSRSAPNPPNSVGGSHSTSTFYPAGPQSPSDVVVFSELRVSSSSSPSTSPPLSPSTASSSSSSTPPIVDSSSCSSSNSKRETSENGSCGSSSSRPPIPPPRRQSASRKARGGASREVRSSSDPDEQQRHSSTHL